VATIRRILAALPGSKVTQDGDDGQNITFPAKHLETVAGILGLRKRRVMPESQRKSKEAELAPFRFSANPSRQSEKTDRQATISGAGGSSVA